MQQLLCSNNLFCYLHVVNSKASVPYEYAFSYAFVSGQVSSIENLKWDFASTIANKVFNHEQGHAFTIFVDITFVLISTSPAIAVWNKEKLSLFSIEAYILIGQL